MSLVDKDFEDLEKKFHSISISHSNATRCAGTTVALGLFLLGREIRRGLEALANKDKDE